jgi:hypothetical protein
MSQDLMLVCLSDSDILTNTSSTEILLIVAILFEEGSYRSRRPNSVK